MKKKKRPDNPLNRRRYSKMRIKCEINSNSNFLNNILICHSVSQSPHPVVDNVVQPAPPVQHFQCLISAGVLLLRE